MATLASERGMQLARVDCERALDSAILRLAPTLQALGALVTRDPLPVVRADAERLREVLQHLIDNAVKFRAAEPPWIHVSAGREGDGWLVAVSDNGIGIEKEDADRLVGGEARGGLGACLRIVAAHGGRLWVDSIPGRGSTFCFILPGA